jgi:hypothetical protein
MIAHPDIATTAALGAYHERIELARINHMINRAVRERTGAPVDATRNDTTTPITRTTRLTRSIKRLLGSEPQPRLVGDSHPGTINPPPMTPNPS